MTGVPAAVDGGQSGIRMRLAGHPETVRAEGFGRLEGDTATGLLDRIRACLAQLPGGAPRISRLALGLTTVPEGLEARHALAARLGRELGAAEVLLAGDEVTAHAGALRGSAGVVLAVGTGIACLGLDPATGAVRHVDGDGFLLGDAGSAFWLGSRGVEAVLRARDGRGAATALEDACVRRFGAHPRLAAWLHDRPRAVAEIAGFAVEVQEAARGGDAVASALVEAAAEELHATSRAAADAVPATPCPLALIGGAVRDGGALHTALARRVAADPSLALRAAAGDPLDGAWGIADGTLTDAYADHLSIWRAP